MLKNYAFMLEYQYDGIKYVSEANENNHYSISATASKDAIKITLEPKVKISLTNAYIKYKYNYLDSDRIYVNGYQSWTTSREYTKENVQRGLLGLSKVPPVRCLSTLTGDYDFQYYSLKKGEFHSYSYTYINSSGKIKLFGTLSERTGYTIFHHNMNTSELIVQKDVEGVTIDQPYVVFDIYAAEGSYNEVFDKYFAILALPKLKYKHMSGYTSWYNYYGAITEEILSRDIDGLATLGDKVDIFQIDDGYQTATGDWLSVKTELYPNGMKYLVDKIHSKGYKAGLWLAPFNAQRSSKVVKQHKDWLIKEPNSDKLQLGCIAWGGAYTLDFYNKEAADYIKKCFDGVLNDWGFDMVKLDFLYSVCRTPRHNKSRGQIMCEAMDFLRECVGDKIILGCGVPLFPTFGKVDMCRISSDVAPTFKDPFYVNSTNQEIISAKSAMNNTIFRRHLDGRAFVNDPDVFYVRKNNLKGIDPLTTKKSKLKFTDNQKLLLATVNNMCGNVLFVSDNVGDFDENQRKMALDAFKATEKVVLDAKYTDKNEVTITYQEGENNYKLVFDTVSGVNNTVKL